MIAIVDYGMGNLRSVSKAFQSQGFTVNVTRDPGDIRSASGLVLPGQGAFGDCVKNLEENGIFQTIKEFIQSGRPYLGICLGLQVLFEGSEESPGVAGLGLLKGKVVRFPSFKKERLKVPHMGWNRIGIRKKTALLEGIPDGSWFYFVHSYFPVPEDESVTAITCTYGLEFTAAVATGNIFACQFHPEKSSAYGLMLLRNFGLLCGEKMKTANP
ncbi:MAG TPA: imidazole glycerol phosphate synthase subunit HisH [Thermodesulfobacteriota bacterium]|nr:imidazole glycerol phosphate synthase subunit HisH [Thermodesulfobacteriota bacterium]